jgi:hypothetical protein
MCRNNSSALRWRAVTGCERPEQRGRENKVVHKATLRKSDLVAKLSSHGLLFWEEDWAYPGVFSFPLFWLHR